MKKLKDLLTELSDLKSDAEAIIPDGHGLLTYEEATVKGTIEAYNQAIYAVKRLRTETLETVLKSIDRTILHYTIYQEEKKDELAAGVNYYENYDFLLYYIAARNTLEKCRESIVKVLS